jgi:hypothetical protein
MSEGRIMSPKEQLDMLFGLVESMHGALTMLHRATSDIVYGDQYTEAEAAEFWRDDDRVRSLLMALERFEDEMPKGFGATLITLYARVRAMETALRSGMALAGAEALVRKTKEDAGDER